MENVSSTTGTEGRSAGERVLEGTGAAPGVAVGTAFRYDASAPAVRQETVAPDAIDQEVELFADGVQRAQQELETIRAVAPEAAEADTDALIEAQALMLRDDEFLGAVRRRIRETHASAGAAVQAVLNAHRERMEASDDAYLRDRADELVALETRLLRALRQGAVAHAIDTHSVLVAQSLTATDLLRLSPHNLLGCVTAESGATSHVAVVAEALSVPLLVTAPETLRDVPSGTPVIVDADAGRLVLHPTTETRKRYRRRQAEQDAPPSPASAPLFPGPAATEDGRPVAVRANIGLKEELNLLAPYGAQGVGLLRTELFFLAHGDGRLDEDHQADAYRAVAEAAGDAGAAVRLLDLGGDDRLPRLHTAPRANNPFLGWRGIRRLLDCPDDLLRPQLRALLRANQHGSLRVLLPMVTDPDEVARVRALLTEESDRLAQNGVPHDPDMPLGIVVEVPAAALQAHAFTEHVDFFSVGTNDLTQYVLAVDRDNPRVASRHSALHPAVLGLLLRVVEAGRTAGCPVEVCGEVAGDVQAVPVLLGLGVEALSVAPQHLPAVQRLVRAVRYDATKALAREALSEPDAAAVRRRAREWLDAHGPSSEPQNP